MELRQLRHYLALVEERSITRAAKRELIVQSGLSNSIQALERELGTPLYVRGTRPVRLTAAGEALVGPARRTLTSAAQAEQAVHHTRDVLIGTLRIGISLSAQHLVPFASYLGEFTRDHPGIDLRLQYAPALTMISMVETGELDCVIGPAVSQVPGLRMTRLAREPLHLVCRADHRLAEQAEVSLRQLANERFVEVPPGWTARLLSEAAFASEGIQRRVVCEVGDWELFLELVSAGVGIGFAPVGLQYPVLTAPDSVLRLIAVEGVRLEGTST
jgi:DNA-binding transcriptional LysR family regulator